MNLAENLVVQLPKSGVKYFFVQSSVSYPIHSAGDVFLSCHVAILINLTCDDETNIIKTFVLLNGLC